MSKNGNVISILLVHTHGLYIVLKMFQCYIYHSKIIQW